MEEGLIEFRQNNWTGNHLRK